MNFSSEVIDSMATWNIIGSQTINFATVSSRSCVFSTFLTLLLHRDLETHCQCLFLHMALLNYFPILTRNQLVESRRVSFKIPQLLRNAARGPIGRHSAFGTDLHGCKRRATRDRSTTRAPTSESFNCSSTTQNFRDFHFTRR